MTDWEQTFNKQIIKKCLAKGCNRNINDTETFCYEHGRILRDKLK